MEIRFVANKQQHGREGNVREGVRKPRMLRKHTSFKESILRKEKEKKGNMRFLNCIDAQAAWLQCYGPESQWWVWMMADVASSNWKGRSIRSGGQGIPSACLSKSHPKNAPVVLFVQPSDVGRNRSPSVWNLSKLQLTFLF